MEASIGDLYEAFYAQLENQDRIFEFWITLTFAVAAGAFIAAKKLTRSLFVMLTAMYLIVSINLILRSIVSALKFRELQTQLAMAGESFPADDLKIGIAVLTVLTFIAGTLATLYFVWHTYREARNADEP